MLFLYLLKDRINYKNKIIAFSLLIKQILINLVNFINFHKRTNIIIISMF